VLTTKELRFFSMARDQAKSSQAGGGIPIGSVLVSGDRVLGVGHIDGYKIPTRPPTPKFSVLGTHNFDPSTTMRFSIQL